MVIFSILDALLPAIAIWVTIIMVRQAREYTKVEVRLLEGRLRDVEAALASTTIKADRMETYCLKLAEDFERAGLAAERTCPECDNIKPERDFEDHGG